VTSDMARLSSLEAVLGDAATVTRYPHLTALLFTALLSLSASQARAAGAGKEVARISSRILDTLLSALPPVQAVTLLTAAARTEAGPRLVAALGGLARLVAGLEARHVSQHARELVAALLRTYDSPESAVRKASVNCLVTLHSVLGEAELAPHLDTLTGPKRKLLSLYILRQNQQI